ncbi:CaiB/BaiF CoA transferase family protein [Litoreibacter arenae]|uniref:L-carnitine dehydratase/bile acid-inducible protein F n=1 Tax=Litoreibacter arenae DSM 19593 TaxID=1123360 RepID=S9QAY3_9RHOB|nr:CaiB/BaiF CoA-transferase family protein [Litoreibacter arenae]EPX77097.1 L-carnitine dehydratase/bile acid-inducible protein F [Litoreibacter arenae DSM 19593]
MQTGPLQGVLVVSIEQAVAAPYCTSRLADAGARVIKVERPEGDFARGYDKAAGGESSYFVWLNRGKESVTLDLSDESDKDLLLAMVDQADVLVQNLKPGALERKGLGPQTLRERNKALITCSISGYGESGPYASRKAYDLLIQAESGLCSITGGPTEPSRVGISIVDIATGAAAQSAILEALIGRERTGIGSDIRISMFEVMADWLAVPLLHAASGNPPQRIGLAHPSICPYGVFSTSDGQDLLISIQNDREWAVFATQVLDRPDMITDPEYATNNARMSIRARVDKIIADAVSDRTNAEMEQILTAGNIAFAGVKDMQGLIDHPHLVTSTVSTPDGHDISLPAPPALFDGVRRMDKSSMPSLGRDTAAIRKEFGRG